MYTDPGTKAADDAVAKLERRLRRVYRQAQEEIQEKLDAFLGSSAARQKAMLQKLKDGTITKTEYDSWMRGQVFQGDQWKAKLDSVTQTLADANKIALKMVNGESQDVFAENATYQNYRMEHDAGVDFGFGIYDSATVTRLIRERPDVLPQRSLNIPKDKAWNRRNFLNIITQGIIQGESIPKIAKRMAEETGSTNRKQMIRTARTTMTGAQNAGRIEAMKSAQQKGINVRKRWMATLDFRTRDAHGHLDGQVQDVDKPFHSDLGPIMYPGDFSAAPANYYNCRCTLVNVYPDYQQPVGIGAEVNGVKVLLQGQTQPGIPRRDNISGEMIGDMTYDEWKAAKNAAASEVPHHIVVQGKDLTGEWNRRKGDYEFEIEDVINAQGFDGIPRSVDSDEFDRLVTEANGGKGFVAQRTYSAPDEQTLEVYRDQLYNGKWYVDCSTGGAQYGRGMYSAADYSGKLSEGIKEEMQHYIETNRVRGNNYSRIETFTLDKSAKIITYDEIEKKFREYTKTQDYNTLLDKAMGTIFDEMGLTSSQKKDYGKMMHGYWTATTKKQVAQYNEIVSKVGYTKQDVHLLADRINAQYHVFDDARIHDIGSYAALLGYDAINAEGHGASGSYTVILNRTKVIFRR